MANNINNHKSNSQKPICPFLLNATKEELKQIMNAPNLPELVDATDKCRVHYYLTGKRGFSLDGLMPR
jgi:hypothetical protein